MLNILENRIQLAHLPTPVQKLESLSELFAGPEIYIKRDDLTGIGFSGNKIRKLEYCAYAAREKGCDLLITCGGIQSNHARATAAVAAKLGMKCHLVLNGNPPEIAEGNHFLDMMFGTDISYVSNCELGDLEKEIFRIAETSKDKGYKPYMVPLGASDATGSLGYIRAVKEMKKQFSDMGFIPDHIISAAGSGGTMSGLTAGKALFDLSSKITGFSVAFERVSLETKIKGVIREIRDTYFPEIIPDLADFDIIDSYVGEGYTKTDLEQLELIKKVAGLEAILLDPTYTGKAMFGLSREIEKGTFKKGEKVLFLHTGGVFGLFPYREMLQKKYKLIG